MIDFKKDLDADLKKIDERLYLSMDNNNDDTITLNIFLHLNDKNEKWISSFTYTDDKWYCSFASEIYRKLSLKILNMITKKYFLIVNLRKIEEKIGLIDDIKINVENNNNSENITQPSRYKTKSGKQVLDLLKEDLLSDSEYIGFLKGNLYKYIHRYQRKNGKEDLEKAKFYLEELKNYEYKD